jgi:hypothetical protein
MAGLVYDLLPQETYLLEQPLVTDVGYELVSPSISSQIIKNQILLNNTYEAFKLINFEALLNKIKFYLFCIR